MQTADGSWVRHSLINLMGVMLAFQVCQALPLDVWAPACSRGRGRSSPIAICWLPPGTVFVFSSTSTPQN